MQPDYNQASAILLLEILKATASNGSQISIPSSPTDFFSVSRSDEWVNSLWFVSLTLSLITALVAVLVKQWLHQYIAIVSDSSARDRARIRHMRYAGLQTWQVPMIIGMLPVLLHISLALFFAGLAVFLFSLGMKVAWLVSIIGAATYVAYTIALILPLIYPYCPFKVPLTLYIHSLYQFVSTFIISRTIFFIRHYPYTHVFHRHCDWRFHKYRRDRESDVQRQKRPLKEIERAHVQKCAAEVDARSLQWLHSSTSNASVHQSMLQAIAGISSATLKWLPDEYRSALMVSLEQQMQRTEPLVSSPEGDEFCLYCKAFTVLCGYPMDKFPIEQLKGILLSGTTMPPAVLPRILQGPQRSSLTLHSMMWKRLVGDAITFLARPSNGALELELELMKIIVRPLSKGESEEVTTIDKPTDEMRKCILDILSHYRRLPITIESTTTDSFTLDLRIILALINRMEQRLCESVHTSNRKQLIETSLTIIECTGNLRLSSAKEGLSIRSMLYQLLSSKAFVVVSPDLQTLVCKIFIVLHRYHSFMKSVPPDIRFYSVAYQCYLHLPVGGGKSSENDVMPSSLGRLISSSLNLPPAPSMVNFEFCKTPLSPLNPHHYPHFSIDELFQVMLLLIKEHHESVLYEWLQHPAMQYVWSECLSRLVRWTSKVPQWPLAGEREQFRQWDFLKRVLAVVVIGELQNILDHSDENESLPQYDYDAYKDVSQLPWLHEVAGSSR